MPAMRLIIVLLLFISINGFGQWKDYIISVKGDTLNRLDLQGKKQGPWVVHVDPLRGEPGYDEQGYYVNDQKDGRWIKFSLMGDKLAEETYRWGNLNGKSRYYTNRGGLVREETWRAVEPGKSMDTVDILDINDPTKVIDRAIVKVEGLTVKHGTWTYYDPEWGTILKTENYWMNKLRTGNEIADVDDDLKPLDISGTGKNKMDTTGKKTLSKPQAILDYEKKNSGKKKIKARDGSTGL